MRKTVVKTSGTYDYGEKKPMVLTIKSEKIEFQKDSGLLRITGPVQEGPEDIRKQSYHTMQIGLNTVLTIRKKQWKSYQIERLEKARVKKPLLLICVLDREEADLAVLKESGIEMKASITNYDRENMEEYYRHIISLLKGQDFKTFVLAGPGFERENLFRYIQRNEKDLSGKIILEQSSSTGINGVQEVVKKSANRVLKETRIAKESEYVDEILKKIKTNGLVVYGVNETEKAIGLGAVETLFVSHEKIRDFEKLMEKQEKMRGKIVIIGSDHELGEQFLHLGGIAGFLRFRVDF
jgi:protein pelota